jgi:hypothetical protein
MTRVTLLCQRLEMKEILFRHVVSELWQFDDPYIPLELMNYEHK